MKKYISHLQFRTNSRNGIVSSILFLVLMTVVSCSFFNSKGKYSDYDGKAIGVFLSERARIGEFEAGEDSPSGREVKLENLENPALKNLKGYRISEYVRKGSESKVEVRAMSFPTISDSKKYIEDFLKSSKEESSGEIITREESSKGSVLVYQETNARGPFTVIDCREGLCLTLRRKMGGKHDDALTFYDDFKKHSSF